ncbi:MAG: LysR family transcriptional regulator [Verrucomicrobia bacterium]|nr:LysR family transcriptional regulator [Verrucomicrobiota bacterium]
MTNIHHLELFYYVARFGGISEAVRNIPYGIQQPAVSAQILQLEDALGVTLFRRRPFALNPPGEKLYAFIKPFFDGVEAVGNEIRGDSQELRVGGSGILLRDHLPEVLLSIRHKQPGLKLTLREGHRPQLEAWLRNQELDIATTLLEGKCPPGLNSMRLLDLPMVLLVEKSSRIAAAADLWKRDKIEEALICLPPYETIPRQFQQGLARIGVDWLPRIEVSSLSLIETYVAYGYGIGLYVDIPRYKYAPKIRVLPLPEFPPVVLGALWCGKKTPMVETFITEIQNRIKAFTT